VERLRDWADPTYEIQPGELDDIRRDMLSAAALLSLAALPVKPQPKPLTDEQLRKIGETLGKRITGMSDYESWPGMGYRKDEAGAYSVPNVPEIAIRYARAVLAAQQEQKP
jgi:hypothetical protein